MLLISIYLLWENTTVGTTVYEVRNHAHGGQFRLPVLGGLIAPGQGIFPEYDSGVFTSGNTKMVVSRGIGNSIIPVRIFNRPELVIITLKSA